MKNKLLYFTIIYLSCFAFDARAQRFIPLLGEGSSINSGQQGPSGEVHDIIEYNNTLLFTGRFSDVNGADEMAFVASWNGTNFEAFEPNIPDLSGSSAIISALASPLGLVLSGRMSSENNIIISDGSTWETMGEGFDNTVFDLIWFNDELYAAGRFENSGAIPTSGVAKWDGSAWIAVDGGMDNVVYDLEVYNNQLYAVGMFTMAGSEACAGIARLNNNAWESLGNGVDGNAYCMTVIDNELYIGGAFDGDANATQNFYGLCAFDGTAFSPLHEGPETFDVASIVQLGGNIIVSETGPGFTSSLKKGTSKQLINNGLEDLSISWPAVHHAVNWNNTVYTSQTNYNEVIGSGQNYLNNAIFKFAQNGSTSASIFTAQVRGLVNPSATLFYNEATSNAAFFVGEEGPIAATIYAAAPWISAQTTENETLYSNYQNYGGDETAGAFYFGPFSSNYDLDYLEKYFQVWSLSAEEVDEHISMYDTPGYSAPAAILNWPGNGRQEYGESLHLAPFEDSNMNGLYEPNLGDYPVIRGDRCVFYILSTDRDDVNSTDLVCEIMVMLYAFDDEPESVFVNYKITNKSTNNYEQFKLGMWSDGDIGSSIDDYIGSSPENNFYYYYNGDDFDEASAGSIGFGDNPPMQAVSFLDQTMSHFLSYNNSTNPINGEPMIALHYDNYLNGLWKDGSPLLFGGNGTAMGNGDPENPTAYMFPSDPNLPAGDDVWNETSAGNPPADRRGVGSFESTTLAAGESLEFDLAFITAFPDGQMASPAENFANLLALNNDLVSFYALQEFNTPETFPVGLNEFEDGALSELLIYPNPCDQSFSLLSRNTSVQSLLIRDAQGKVIDEIEDLSSSSLIDISHLNPGMYFVHVKDGQGNEQSLKLIKK
jgi:hypothetical protein